MTPDEAEPTEAEVLAARQKIRDDGRAALDKLLESSSKNHYATHLDLTYLHEVLWAQLMDFTLEHVRRRAVLREDVAPSATAEMLKPMWRGVFREDQAYAKGALVAASHSLWIAEQGTTQRPGTPNSGWRLILKGPR